MLNEEKLKTMIKLASFESTKGQEALKIGSYYKRDYVGYQMLKSGVYLTIAYILGATLWGLSHLESLTKMMEEFHIITFVKQFGAPYILALVIYLLISFIHYSNKYQWAKMELTKYHRELRRLERTYIEEGSKTEKTGKLEGVHDDEIIGD